MRRPRPLTALVVAWFLLLLPSVPLFGHECHGFVGFLAHTPLYAFQGLTVLLAAGLIVAAERRVRYSA